MSTDWRRQGINKERRRTGYDMELPAAPDTPAPDFTAGHRVPGTLGEVQISVAFRMRGSNDQPTRINYVLGR